MLPSACALCRGWGRGPVCAGCAAAGTRAIPRCERCALQVPDGTSVCGTCLLQPPPQVRTVAAEDYAPPWDRLIGQLKFNAALDLAEPLAARLRAALDRTAAEAPDLVLPAPLAPRRLRERGFNQAWEIARRLRRPADPALLLRLRATVPQAELPRAQRLASVRGAYAVDARRRRDVAGRHVAIVDDVMTTGASAAAMAQAVLEAGAARVSVWVVARTPAPDGP